MKIAILSAELTNDPLTRGYDAMTNEEAAEDIETIYRPGLCGVGVLGEYIALNRKNNMSLLGRLSIIANSAVGLDPLGDAIVLTQTHLTACITMLSLVGPGSLFSLNLNDANFQLLLTDISGTGAKVISPSDKTAITALSDNRRTRAAELEIKTRVRAGDIQRARV